MSSLHPASADHHSVAPLFPAPAVPTSEEIARAIASGNRLRAHALGDAIRRLWHSVTAPFDRSRPKERPDEPVANALAAIRSAAELMRDNPDLDASDRTRFVNMVLREEARLETMLDKWRGGGLRAA